MQLFYPTPKLDHRGDACPAVASRVHSEHPPARTLPGIGGSCAAAIRVMRELTHKASTQRDAIEIAETGSGKPNA